MPPWRGRGRGRGGRGFGPPAKDMEFVLYPDVQLPDSKSVKLVEEKLVYLSENIEKLGRRSAYYLKMEGKEVVKNQRADIEKYSDKANQIQEKRQGFLRDYLVLRTDNFPSELMDDHKKKQKEDEKNKKKRKLNLDSDMLNFDKFEKMEQEHEGKERKDKTVKIDDENEEEKEEDEDLDADVDSESSDPDDYEQNIDFDDDEDDYNQVDDDDEPYYE